ncbi:MAG: hypothetical protein JWN98_2574 [Abditibacteriota bacterium]|nr:hypothetical protein [Abditibacteriota bacterium]
MKNETKKKFRSSCAHHRAPFRLSRRLAVRVALGLAVLPLTGLLLQWLRDEDAGVTVIDTSLRPSLEAFGAQSIIVRDKGRKVWEFSADRITWSADHRFATATNLRRGVLFRDGKPFLTVSAARVVLNQESRNWEASGQLQASGPHGFSLSTQRATWSHQRERLSCPEAVQAKVRGMTIETRDIFYEAKTGQLKCPQPVQVRSAQAIIQGGRDVVADIRTRRVEFRSGVHITIKRSALDALAARSQKPATANASGTAASVPPTAMQSSR